jgi:hydrogenase/urease accessory protein HupE
MNGAVKAIGFTYVRIIVFILAFFLGLSNDRQTAGAHPLNNGYSELNVHEDNVAYELFIPDYSLAPYDQNHDGSLTAEELLLHQAELEKELQSNLRLEQDKEIMTFSLRSIVKTEKDTIPGAVFSILYSSTKPITEFTIQYNLLFDKVDPNHINFALILDGDDVDQTIFDSGSRSYHFESLHPRTLISTLWTYMLLGIEHIVTGFDHLLFVLALILVTTKLRDIVKIVTAFTVAHSITLLLATLGFIKMNPVWVESIIALTICYVALENISTAKHGHRPLLTFIFGLVHGMGFAGALGEIGLPKHYFIGSLLTFNLGVEIGQLVIVALVLPLLLWLRKFPWHRNIVVIGSALIFARALWWLLERTGVIG